MAQARAPRADAVRNRAKVLAAAREQITAHGPEIGMDEIAATAGVAVGTVYRNFPTKTDLVAAVVAESTARLADDAESARERVEAGARALDELTAFLAHIVETAAADLAVKAAAAVLGAATMAPDVEARIGTAVAGIIQKGQEDGDIHPDITAEDIYLFFSTAPTDQPPAIRDRWLALAARGLATRARGSHS